MEPHPECLEACNHKECLVDESLQKLTVDKAVDTEIFQGKEYGKDESDESREYPYLGNKVKLKILLLDCLEYLAECAKYYLEAEQRYYPGQ